MYRLAEFLTSNILDVALKHEQNGPQGQPTFFPVNFQSLSE